MKPILFAFVAVFLTPITAPCLAQIAACASDVSGDGVVSGADLALVLGGWGPCTTCDGDVNGDHILQFAELKLGADIVMLATPELGGLPYVVSGLVAAGGLAAALSTACTWSPTLPKANAGKTLTSSTGIESPPAWTAAP